MLMSLFFGTYLVILYHFHVRSSISEFTGIVQECESRVTNICSKHHLQILYHHLPHALLRVTHTPWTRTWFAWFSFLILNSNCSTTIHWQYSFTIVVLWLVLIPSEHNNQTEQQTIQYNCRCARTVGGEQEHNEFSLYL